MFSNFNFKKKQLAGRNFARSQCFMFSLAFLFLSLVLIKAYSGTLKRIFENINLKKHTLSLFLLICLDNVTFKAIFLN